MDEAEAIARLKAGDITGLHTLIERYQVQAVQTAALITQDRAMAEDIVQNAFVRIYQRIGQFDDTRLFRPWFLRIVINDALKAAVRQKRHISLDADNDAACLKLIERLEASVEKPEDIIERNEVRETIREAFKERSPRQRAAVVLRYYLGFSEEEMSSKLNCAPGTVKWHLYTARERLRTLLLPFVK